MRFALAAAVCGLYFAATAAADYRVPSVSSASLVNAATGQAGYAPYSICTLYGSDLYLNGTAAAWGHSDVPTVLGGVTVLFGRVPAGVLYVSQTQINLLVPNSLTPGAYAVKVVRDGLSSAPISVVLDEVAPGLFPLRTGFAVALHVDGTPVTENAPAQPGEVVAFYATGLGRTQPDPSDRAIAISAAPIAHAADFQVLLDGVALDFSRVEYAGIAPYNAGLYQINVRLPNDLPATNPEVRIRVAGTLSPTGLRLITGPIATQ